LRQTFFTAHPGRRGGLLEWLSGWFSLAASRSLLACEWVLPRGFSFHYPRQVKWILNIEAWSFSDAWILKFEIYP